MTLAGEISLPPDFYTNFLMLLRWIHFLAGIMWIGLLYFFNLVGFRSMQELDPATRGKVMPGLMMRALWWFRWSALVTVLAGQLPVVRLTSETLRFRRRDVEALLDPLKSETSTEQTEAREFADTGGGHGTA